MTSKAIRWENEMIKKRERQLEQEQVWKTQEKYYASFDRKNAKFDEWTSPRYQEAQIRQYEESKHNQLEEEHLEKRRDKLRQLMMEEDKANQIQVMMAKLNHSESTRRTPRRHDEIPVEILNDLNKNLKVEADERCRRDAELKLYHQWRRDNPILSHYERMQRGRDLKLSWLDQQIEVRMKKEKEEEECRKILKERDKRVEEMEKRELMEKQEIQEKKSRLARCLDEQIKELRSKSEAFEALKVKENEIARKKFDLDEIEVGKEEELKRRLAKECALYNVKQHKLKLKAKAREVVENLENERELVRKLKDFDLAEQIECDLKKREVKDTILQFLDLNRQQKELEKRRQLQLDFVFDSECREIYQRQEEIWKREEQSRLALLTDVLDEIRKQIEDKLQESVKLQRLALEERERVAERIEQYDREIQHLQTMESRRKIDRKRELDEDVAVKKAQESLEKSKSLRKINEELEQVRKEEDRLQNEIMLMQRKQGPYRPVRNRIIY